MIGKVRLLRFRGLRGEHRALADEESVGGDAQLTFSPAHIALFLSRALHRLPEGGCLTPLLPGAMSGEAQWAS